MNKQSPTTINLAGISSFEQYQAQTVTKSKSIDIESIYHDAKNCIANNDLDKAASLIQEIKNSAPNHDYILHLEGLMGQAVTNYALALENFLALKNRHPENTQIDLSLGDIYIKKREPYKAKPYLDSAIKNHPSAESHFAQAQLYIYLGNREKIKHHLSEALKEDPKNPDYLYLYFLYANKNDSEKSPYFKTLLSLINEDMSHEQKAYTYYGLFRAYQSLEKYDEAFDYALKAGQVRRDSTPYNRENALNLFSGIQQYFTKDLLEHSKVKGSVSDRHIFILGMPRSGTSLLEQILHAHPDIAGIGEDVSLSNMIENYSFLQNFDGMAYPLRTKNNPFYLTVEAIAEQYETVVGNQTNNEKRIVNKSIGNRLWAGFIKIAFPNAKFIHINRNPIDCCLSCFTTNFLTNAQAYSYDLKELAEHYKWHDALINHWKETLGDSIIHISYENLVKDIEGEAKRLINFLDLPWNESCLDFYKIDKSVATASATQVREPIYNKSINSWKKYANGLTPLIEELGNLAPKDAQEFLEKTKNG